jgi:hypothetical protein
MEKRLPQLNRYIKQKTKRGANHPPERNRMAQSKPIFGVPIQLTGADGNAFAILGACSKEARKNGIEREKINEFMEEAKSGDYDHLLQTCHKYFDVN